jgi:hypothetical protein
MRRTCLLACLALAACDDGGTAASGRDASRPDAAIEWDGGASQADGVGIQLRSVGVDR